MGRPKKKVDAATVTALARMGLTQAEIGQIVHVSHDTLNRRYRAALETGYAEMKLSLRKSQFDNAVKHRNVTMQIWLGKQFLGQRNEPSTTSQAGQLDRLLESFEGKWRHEGAVTPKSDDPTLKPIEPEKGEGDGGNS